jgi:hypothetical protein
MTGPGGSGNPVSLQQVSGRFHSVARAPHASRPSIKVEHDHGPLVGMLLDFGVGKPGQERRVLEIAHPGTFRFPERIDEGELLYVRCRHLPGEVRISVQWEPED